jgi:organic hydroperoxide reductase OsmC/OhrA
MSEHRATTTWTRGERTFTYEEYDRGHRIVFGGGAALAASAAHEFRGDAARPNPEEELVGALSTCHMLTFLAIAARRGLTIDRYEDEAVGTLEKNAEGRLAVTRCLLHPRVTFAPGITVEAEALRALHTQAHRGCFIAASVKTEVTVA